MGLRVLLLACRRTGLDTIQKISTGGHQLAGVVSADFDGQIDDGVRAEVLLEQARQAGAQTWQTRTIHSPAMLDAFKALKPDIGISMGWRRLVRAPLIDLPVHGFVNFHTSDLPKYRGFASTSWAILNGEKRTAITAHRMVDGVADEGAILKKEFIPIGPETDIAALLDQINARAPSMCLSVLDDLEAGRIEKTEQADDRAILSFPRWPVDGWIDWHRTAQKIDRLVRAVTRPYPGARTCLKEKEVLIWKGRVLEKPPRFAGVPGHVVKHLPDGAVWVLTGGGIYVIADADLEGAAAAKPAALFAGMQNRLGLSVGEMFYHLRRNLPERS